MTHRESSLLQTAYSLRFFRWGCGRGFTDCRHPMKVLIKEIWKFGPMWQTKYALAVPNNWEWEWIFGPAVMAISSPAVRSPWEASNIYRKLRTHGVKKWHWGEKGLKVRKKWRRHLWMDPLMSISMTSIIVIWLN